MLRKTLFAYVITTAGQPVTHLFFNVCAARSCQARCGKLSICVPVRSSAWQSNHFNQKVSSNQRDQKAYINNITLILLEEVFFRMVVCRGIFFNERNVLSSKKVEKHCLKLRNPITNIKGSDKSSRDLFLIIVLMIWGKTSVKRLKYFAEDP